MNLDKMIFYILLSLYEAGCVVVKIDQDPHEYKVYLHIREDMSTIALEDGKVVNRGPHLSKKVKETFEELSGSKTHPYYKFVPVSEFPDKEIYMYNLVQTYLKETGGQVS